MTIWIQFPGHSIVLSLKAGRRCVLCVLFNRTKIVLAIDKPRGTGNDDEQREFDVKAKTGIKK